MIKSFFTAILLLLAVSQASQADGLPTTPFSWTGFYAGAHVGAGQLVADWNFPKTNVFSGRNFDSGWLGGGQAGFNYQTGSWVWGIEGQFSWARLAADNVDASFGGDRNHTNTDYVGTLAARVGYTLDRFLAFGKAGGALSHNTYSTTDSTGSVTSVANDTRLGWMLGTGLEYALTQNWSMKAEYDYMNFGNHRLTFSPVGGGFPYDEDIGQRISLIMVGINYRFGDRRDEVPLK